jgi:sugar lactone lactonase YvrE
MKTFLLRRCCAALLSLAVAGKSFAAADYSTPYNFTTLAGTSSIGSADGAGANARFYSPQDIATDSAGNVFIVDEGNHTIRKMTAAGVVTTFAGVAGVPGSSDGTGAAASFDSPQGIVADAADNLYVTDTGNHTIRKITPAGVVTTLAGRPGITGNTDGSGSAARFNLPRKIARDSAGNLYVTEIGNGTIRKITATGEVSTYATGFSFPEYFNGAYGAIAVDAAGNVYVSNFAFTDARVGNNGAVSYSYIGFLMRVGPNGDRTSIDQSTINQNPDGQVENFGFSGLKSDLAGNLLIGRGYRLVKYNPSTGLFTDLSGSGQIGAVDGPANTARFGFPFTAASDRNGTLYVADTGNNLVRKVASDGAVSTLAGVALENAAANADGAGAAARFTKPTGVAVDGAGNVYVADTDQHCIRKISPAGVVTTLAGNPGQAGSADGMGTAARFNSPRGLAVDATGAVFVADTVNRTIRRISPAGEVSVIAGAAGQIGADDGNGAAARFAFPIGLAIDATGNLFVTDWSNQTIRKITPARDVTTVAGSPLLTGETDGLGSAARFTAPYGIAVDAACGRTPFGV